MGLQCLKTSIMFVLNLLSSKLICCHPLTNYFHETWFWDPLPSKRPSNSTMFNNYSCHVHREWSNLYSTFRKWDKGFGQHWWAWSLSAQAPGQRVVAMDGKFYVNFIGYTLLKSGPKIECSPHRPSHIQLISSNCLPPTKAKSHFLFFLITKCISTWAKSDIWYHDIWL